MTSGKHSKGLLPFIAIPVFFISFLLVKNLNLTNIEISALRSLGYPLAFAFTLFMILAGGCGVPPVLAVIPAGAIWSFPVASCVCLVGGLGASGLGFFLARYGFRETLTPKIPPKILRFERGLENHTFCTVVVLRLLFYLFPPINWMLGISQLRPLTFFSATFLGMLPSTFAYLWVGQGIIGLIMGL